MRQPDSAGGRLPLPGVRRAQRVALPPSGEVFCLAAGWGVLRPGLGARIHGRHLLAALCGVHGAAHIAATITWRKLKGDGGRSAY